MPSERRVTAALLLLLPKTAFCLSRFDLGLFEFREIERLQDVTAVLIFLLRNAIDVDAGGGRMPVAERLLRLAQGSCSLSHYPREGVARPV